jgi:hypothetical protein
MYQLHQNIIKEKPMNIQQQELGESIKIQREGTTVGSGTQRESETNKNIKHFYKSKNRKLNATAFYSVKDKQGSPLINFLQHASRNNADWYRQTAKRRLKLTEPREEFLRDINIEFRRDNINARTGWRRNSHRSN